MATPTDASKAALAAKVKVKPKLTRPQLNDLYRRLDINGDGELDLDEFLEVGKKLDFEDEALIIEAFRVADTSGSGKLDMEEFVFAYETMYNGNLESSAGENETFVRAIRYGIDKSCSPAKYVMQMYTGTMSELNKMSDLLNEKETDYKGALETIVAMMVEDGRGNEEFGSNILWWVDLCVEKVLPNVVATVVQNFGLPLDIDSCFYNEILNDDRETRVRMGSGGISKPAVKAVNDDEPLETKSLSFFVQSMYISNVPIVQESGWWVEWLWPKLLQNFFQYLYSRLSQFLSYSGEIDLSLCRAIQLADASSKEFSDFEGSQNEDSLSQSPMMSNSAHPEPPDIDERYKRSDEARFLLGLSDLESRPPEIKFGNLSLHLLDLNSSGGKSSLPNSLLTVRKMEHEKGLHRREKLDWDLEKSSRSGIIGRLINGAILKIFITAKQGGAVPIHGEILDSISYLALVLVILLHNFNMNTLQVVEHWMSIISEHLEDLAISKHSVHIDKIVDICDGIESYVLPFHHVCQDMTASAEDIAARPKKRLRPGQIEVILNREVLFPFLGKQGSSTAFELISGNRSHETKGSSYWLHKLKAQKSGLQSMISRYKDKLDEKRNFWGFMFTLVSIILFPVSVLLAYEGMNFDNQPERGNYLKYFYGIKFFWLEVGVSYAVLILWMLDKKIFYMGT